MEENNQENTSQEKNHETQKPKRDFTTELRKNPWILSTLVLGIIVLILLVGNFSPTGSIITGSIVSKINAGQVVLDLAKAQVENVELISVEEVNGLYKVTLSIDGNDVPVYLTLDGENLVNGLTPLSTLTQQNQETQTPSEITKSDKPLVELFVWGYCPYGIQAQGPLAEVALLLGDYADFKAVMYYDGHGPYETQQNKIQECIQEIAPKKYWDYAAGFVTDIYPKCGSSKDIDCDKTESITLMNSLGINSVQVLSCVEEKGDDLISTASSYASELGVTGSPTIVINGAKASLSSRTAEAFKASICESFNNPPEECLQELSQTAAASSGSC